MVDPCGYTYAYDDVLDAAKLNNTLLQLVFEMHISFDKWELVVSLKSPVAQPASARFPSDALANKFRGVALIMSVSLSRRLTERVGYCLGPTSDKCAALTTYAVVHRHL